MKRASLILVKHSAPLVDPATPVQDWPLSPEGRTRCAWLSDRLAALDVDVLYTSPQAKAWETVDRVGDPVCHPA